MPKGNGKGYGSVSKSGTKKTVKGVSKGKKNK